MKAADENDLKRTLGSAHDPLEGNTPYVPEADKAPAAPKKAAPRTKRRPPQAKQLMTLAAQHGAELFSAEGTAYACVNVGTRRATLRVESTEFARLLRDWFFETQDACASQQAVLDATSTLAARAHHADRTHEICVRTGRAGGALYLDLGNSAGQAVEITAQAWRIVERPPVYFIRPPGMQPLPTPERDGAITELFEFINLPEDSRPLLLGWLVGALRPDGPFPVLAVHGEQGSGKSTSCRMLRELVDPHVASLRSMPRDERTLMIATRRTWLLGFDNLSTLPPWLSDALCCISTGGAYAARALYTDDGEALFIAKRPILLNGIEEIATRADLLDRCIVLKLQAIPEQRRRSEAALWAGFRAALPRLLGVLLDALVCAVRRLPDVNLSRAPRMADFAVWATAAEPAFGLASGGFIDAYFQNISVSSDLPLEASPIAAPLLALLDKEGPTLDGGRSWTGTPTTLLAALRGLADDEDRRQAAWPRNAQALSGQLNRLAPNLRQKGIQVEHSRASDGKRTRIVTVRSERC